MAVRIRIKVNRKAVAQLLKVDAMADLKRRGDNINRAAGSGHEVNATVGPNRARVEVRTATFAARHAEATSRNLTRALDAGRR